MIVDCLVLREPLGGYTIDEDGIMESISDINKDYKISFENGCVPNDIIVAKI